MSDGHDLRAQIGGISHSPMERTSWEDCANGAALLLGAVLDIDAKNTIA